jgi:hypothetical protein
MVCASVSLRWWYAPYTLTLYPLPLLVVVALIPPRTFERAGPRMDQHAHRLHQHVYDLPLTPTRLRLTAYTNTFTTYRLHQHVYDLPLTPTRLRLTANAGWMRLPLTSYRLRLSAYDYLLRKNVYVYLLCFIYYP